MVSMPTWPAGSSRRHDHSLRSTGRLPFAAYQRCRPIHGTSSSSLVGVRVAFRWISAMGSPGNEPQPEEVARAERQRDRAVVGDLREALSAEEVGELGALELLRDPQRGG